MNKLQSEVLEILKDESLTHEQTVHKLAKFAENIIDYPKDIPTKFQEYYNRRYLCDVSEGHAPYCPRYILPDYQKFMENGSKFLRLDPPTNLYEAVNSLLILYRHVPSVTHFPVYMGEIDTLLEPFIDHVHAREIIKNFLIHCDRTFGSSFCHMNLSGNNNKSAYIILDCLYELENAVPNFTILYSQKRTSDDLATKAISTALKCANPAFADIDKYIRDYDGKKVGIVSCYNGLPVGGGAHTLSRIRLNVIAKDSLNKTDFLNNCLKDVVEVLCNFMEEKIKFLNEETPFYKVNFLIREGLINKDEFIGLFGVVGLAEAVNIIMNKEGLNYRFGKNDEANNLGLEILDKLLEYVNEFKTNYSPNNHSRFFLHAQVGAENDEETSPGVRIPIGEEIDILDHILQAGLYHKFFQTGVGDIFPFESTAKGNPDSVLDIYKGAFLNGMRYISSYLEDSDVIRVTGYLVKRSEIEKFNNGYHVINETNKGAYSSGELELALNRKVRNM